jgi:hypothetical protein
MKSKNQQLDELFNKWEISIPEYKGQFIYDGIINEEFYLLSNPKILFITKESNNPLHKPGDFRSWWQDEIKYGFSYRIAEWAYGIQNNFPQYDEIWRKKGSAKKAINQIAFMNIKKNGGGGSSHYDDIMDHLKLNFQLIHQQINIIDPDIIILGLSWRDVRDNLFPEAKWINSGYDVPISKINNYKVIDFYHPSSRNAPAAAYSLLQNIIQSRQFIEL